MYYCKGRFSKLVELNSKNDIFLFSLLKRNEAEYRQFVCDQYLPYTYSEFLNTLKVWFSNGRLYQFLVYPINKNNPIGTIFFYHYDQQEKSVKMSAFFEREARKQLGVAESLAMTITFARQVIQVKSILFNVYAENQHMKNIAEKLIYDRSDKLVMQSCVNQNRNVEIYKMSSSILENVTNKLKKLHR
jgi:RimJ/RimL family protein N-acetyltransferase